MRIFLIFLFSSFFIQANDSTLQEHCRKVVSNAKDVRAIQGQGGWLFNFKEFQHLAKKTLWSESVVQSISKYSKRLKENGIDLIVMPIPPKILIYQEFLNQTTKKANNPYAKFHKELIKQGVKTVDLYESFMSLKETDQSFSKQDSHFSPLMAVKIADLLGTPLKNFKRKGAYKVKVQEMAISGDLSRQLENKPAEEKLKFSFVEGKEGSPINNSESPVLLLGDSNVLIYRTGGDMIARGAGLGDHLSKVLGHDVDLIGVRGSGINVARVDLFRRFMDPKYLKKKKVVIWCFSAHELTETVDWKDVPVTR